MKSRIHFWTVKLVASIFLVLGIFGCIDILFYFIKYTVIGQQLFFLTINLFIHVAMAVTGWYMLQLEYWPHKVALLITAYYILISAYALVSDLSKISASLFWVILFALLLIIRKNFETTQADIDKNNLKKGRVAIILVVAIPTVCTLVLPFALKNFTSFLKAKIENETEILAQHVSNNRKQTIKLPTFSDYPIKNLSTTHSSFPSINISSPVGQKYKTRISAANKEVPNFAGKYSIVSWGCGTHCQVGIIIDRDVGTILDSNLPLITNGYAAQVTSTLFIINPYTPFLETDILAPVTTYYYNWNGETFNLIGSYIITKDSVKISTSSPPYSL